MDAIRRTDSTEPMECVDATAMRVYDGGLLTFVGNLPRKVQNGLM